jgi:hypothetical protein
VQESRTLSEVEEFEALMEAPFLAVGGLECRGRDLLAAGAVSGRWARLERELAAGLALADEAPADASDVDAALRDFRYARRLISAQDFRAWLGVRGLTVAAVRGCLERELVRRRPAAPAPVPAPDLDRFLAALPAEAVCSGALRDCGEWLADRLLAPGDDVATDAERLAEAGAAEAALLATGALAEHEEARLERLARIVAADAAHARRIASVVTEETIAACLQQHRLEWVTVAAESVRCADHSIAAEVVLMLRSDGVPLPDVARAAGLDMRSRTALLADVDGPLAPLLAAAAAGEVIGPVEVDGAYEVWRVARRVAPAAADPGVRERAVAALTAADAERRQSGKVLWHERA